METKSCRKIYSEQKLKFLYFILRLKSSLTRKLGMTVDEEAGFLQCGELLSPLEETHLVFDSASNKTVSDRRNI